MNPGVIGLVATPLPWPLDQEKEARKLFRMTIMLKEYCEGSKFKYVWATQEFVSLTGVNSAMVDDKGLTDLGRSTINRLVTGKIECGRLRNE